MIAELCLAGAFLIFGYVIGCWRTKVQLHSKYIFNRSVFLLSVISTRELYDDHIATVKSCRDKFLLLEEAKNELQEFVNNDYRENYKR
jgi:hypothetical protein